jgi:hypothetical protein
MSHQWRSIWTGRGSEQNEFPRWPIPSGKSDKEASSLSVLLQTAAAQGATLGHHSALAQINGDQ